MNKSHILIGSVIAGIVVFIAMVGVIMNINYNNRYTSLEKRAQAEQQVSKLTFDTTWKVISGQSNVAEKERESFRSVFLDIMNSRTQHDSNLLMKWSTEAQIPISSDLYRKVQDSIEVQREKFLSAQSMLVDLKREADTMKGMFPGSVFLSGRKDIEIKVVTSTKTEEAFNSGIEDNVNPF